MTVQRWVFQDPAIPETYTFPINPRRMTSPWPERVFSISTTTAVSGVSIVMEGNTPPPTWSFGGAVLTKVHHDALVRWYQKKNRWFIFDHFGRRWPVTSKAIDMKPIDADTRIDRNRYWRHEYDMTVLILGAPTAATVGEKWS